MNCPFCQSSSFKSSFLPSTFFNNKQFDYKQCSNCDLHYINPIPNNEDLLALYPPSYQAGVDREIIDPEIPMLGLRFSYRYQFDLIRQTNENGIKVDFGCGNAHFINNAENEGLSFQGVEFNPKHVAVLRAEMPENSFYTVEEFLNSNSKVALIRMSNVLEHFTEPREMMQQLIKKLEQGGKLLIEGPIEMNFSLALQVRKFFFSLRKIFQAKHIADHPPTHIIFSNASNQLKFFEDLGLRTEHFKIKEAAWPFPPSFRAARGIKAKMMAGVAQISIIFGKLIPSWGNTFIYLGSIQSEERSNEI